MKIRNAAMYDINEITAVESACFPEAEAATREEFEKRLVHYADCFWLMTDDNGKIISFVDGMATDRRDLTDEMYENAAIIFSSRKMRLTAACASSKLPFIPKTATFPPSCVKGTMCSSMRPA